LPARALPLPVTAQKIPPLRKAWPLLHERTFAQRTLLAYKRAGTELIRPILWSALIRDFSERRRCPAGYRKPFCGQGGQGQEKGGVQGLPYLLPEPIVSGNVVSVPDHREKS